MFILVIIAYVLIALIEATPLVKKKQRKELVLYSFIFLIAFTISLLLSLGVDIPSLAKVIENAVYTIIGPME